MKKRPTLLAIETAGSFCSAAVAQGDAVTAAECRPARHGHGEILLPMIDRVVGAAGLRPADIDWVAAAVGPGGFTGIRAGLAAAHGIALAAAAGGIGVTSFAAVAAALRVSGRPITCPLLVALDSRRDDLYIQFFAADAIRPLAPPSAVLPTGLAEYAETIAAAGPLLVAGDAAESALAVLTRHRAGTLAAETAPDARGVAAEALRLLRSNAAPPLRPFYLRPPDVSQPSRARSERPA